MDLDDVDKQILNGLFKNGRESLTNMGERVFKGNKIPMSHTGISKRITKLEDSDILKIQGNLNVTTLKYNAAIILLEMKNYEELKKLSKAYKGCPRIFLLANVSGRYNIILGIIGKNIEDLQMYLNLCGPSNQEGVLHTDVLHIGNFETPQFLPMNLFTRKNIDKNCGNVCEECEAFLDGKCDGCGAFL